MKMTAIVVSISAMLGCAMPAALAHDDPAHGNPARKAPAQRNVPQRVQTQAPPAGSQCLAMANAIPGVIYASLKTTATTREQVTITYAGHSTYMIETPGNVTIATDFSGMYTAGKSPNVVTMNRAHSTHYTLNPDPRIAHVLHGWGDDGAAAKHSLVIGDTLIRNVPTDIRGYGYDGAGMQRDGNSIFIFEVAGLCIGHLGHLHHQLNETHYAAIGRLDIVMVPIDGSMTLSLQGMSEITRRLRSSIVLPMHRFSTPLQEFLQRMRGEFAMDIRPERSFTVSVDTLPKAPTVVVLDGV